MDRLKSIRRISDTEKINKLRNVYDKVEIEFRNLHSFGIATAN